MARKTQRARATNGARVAGAADGSSVGASSLASSSALALRTANSDALARLEFLNRFPDFFPDATFNGRRNVSQALGYKRVLQYRDYLHRYRRGGIATRIVEGYPRATWSGQVTVSESQDPEETSTQFEKDIADVIKDNNAIPKFTRADIQSRIGRYSALLIGVNKPGDDLAQEMPKNRKVIYLTPLSEENAVIAQFVTDTSDPRFGLPLTYNVRLGVRSAYGGAAMKQTPVHWSRVIHFADALLDDEVYGTPCLESIWNYLDDLEKIVGGGAEASWRRMDPGMQADIDPTITITPEEKAAFDQTMQEFEHGLRRYVRTRGVKLNPLSASVTGFGPNADAVFGFICAATGYPQRVLLGSERGNLASTQDKGEYWDRIDERRKTVGIPFLSMFVQRLIDYSCIAKPSSGDFTIEWVSHQEVQETEKYTLIAQIALANKNQTDSGDGLILTANEIRDIFLERDPLVGAESEGDTSDELGADPATTPENPDAPTPTPTSAPASKPSAVPAPNATPPATKAAA